MRNTLVTTRNGIMGLCLCLICMLMTGCGMSAQERWQEQYDLGQQYLLDGDYEQAIVSFTAAIEIEPNEAAAYLSRAEAYLEQDITSASAENLQLALSDYDTSLELDDTLTDAYISRADVYVAMGSDDDLSSAIQDYTSALSLDDTLTDVYVSRGDVYQTLGTDEDLRAAISDYTSALALDGSRVELYLTEAGIYTTLEDYEGAVEAYTQAIEGNLGTPDVYRSRAESYYALGYTLISEEEEVLPERAREYLEQALADYEEALADGDTDLETYLSASDIYVLLEDYDRASELLEEALLLYPDSEELATWAVEVEDLMMERAYQEYLASLKQVVEDNYMDSLQGLIAAMEAGPENVGVTDWLGSELREFADSLDAVLIWEQENGWDLALYPGGYVYYGEMTEDGLRSGTGFWFLTSEWADYYHDAYESYEMVGTNELYSGVWEDDCPNGAGEFYLLITRDGDVANGTETWCIEMDFVDGYADGTGTFHYSDSDGVDGECEIQGSYGEMAGIYDYMVLSGYAEYAGKLFVGAWVDPYYFKLDDTISVTGAEIDGATHYAVLKYKTQFEEAYISSKDASGSAGENVTWSYDASSGTLTFTGSGGMTNWECEDDWDSYDNGISDSYRFSSAPWYIYHDFITKIVIEEGVTSIGDYAFIDCENLTEVSFPEGLTRIGALAFSGCTAWQNSLTTLILPEGLTVIETCAFGYFSALTEISLPDSLTEIGGGNFDYCSSLTEVVIPEGVTTIGDMVFYDCDNLSSVTIPVSVTSIGDYSFFHNGGTNIYYKGSEEEWNSIETGELANLTMHYNAE